MERTSKYSGTFDIYKICTKFVEGLEENEIHCHKKEIEEKKISGGHDKRYIIIKYKCIKKINERKKMEVWFSLHCEGNRIKHTKDKNLIKGEIMFFWNMDLKDSELPKYRKKKGIIAKFYKKFYEKYLYKRELNSYIYQMILTRNYFFSLLESLIKKYDK